MRLLRQTSKMSLHSYRSASSTPATSASSVPSTPGKPPASPSGKSLSLSLPEELEATPPSPVGSARSTPSKGNQATRYDPVTSSQLELASRCSLFDHVGAETSLGHVLQLSRHRRVILVFIRHFWCGLCEEYVTALAQLPRDVVHKARVRIIVIGCGSPELITKYRKTTGLPAEWPLYADPSAAIYRILGLMTSLDPGPSSQAGSYVQRGMFANIVHSALSGLKNPLKSPGPMAQLGGEFVLSSERKCIYASRMTTTRNHGDVTDLLAAAGVDLRRSTGIEDEEVL